MTIPTPPARLNSLTSLRFVLAGGVLTCHMAFVTKVFDGPVQQALRTTMPVATTAVSGFFVLSGFVLAWSYREGDRPRSFWRRRAWKIYPTHVLAWVATVVLFAVATRPPLTVTQPGHDPVVAVAGLFLLQDWVPRAGWFSSFNVPAWSLSCEVFFYALFPLLFVAARRIPVHRLRSRWAAVAVLILLLPAVSALVPGPMSLDWVPINETSLWFGYVLPVVRLPEFVLGILTARLVRAGHWPRLTPWAVYAPIVPGFLLLPVLPPQYGMAAAAAPFLAPIIAHRALADLQGTTRRMAHPVLVALGEASYALYVTHYPLMMAVRAALGDRSFTPWAALAVVFALMASSVLLSLVVYRCYEAPLQRRWARARCVRPVGTVVPAMVERDRPRPAGLAPSRRGPARRTGGSGRPWLVVPGLLSPGGAEEDRQGPVVVDDERRHGFEAGGPGGEGELRESAEQGRYRDGGLDPGEVGAEAEVCPVPEGQVLLVGSVEVEVLGAVVDFRRATVRAEGGQQQVAGAQGGVFVEGDVAGDEAQGHVHDRSL
ncbi:peptidoglycan/LPS O-acetylase OafA/YrhL [Embleya sp. AB8]